MGGWWVVVGLEEMVEMNEDKVKVPEGEMVHIMESRHVVEG